jgi:hypothetical protein
MGHASARGGYIDLTQLGRELKAVRDCQPAPLPNDRYHRGAKVTSRE